MTHLTAPEVKNYPFAEYHSPCRNFNMWFSNRNIYGAELSQGVPAHGWGAEQDDF